MSNIYIQESNNIINIIEIAPAAAQEPAFRQVDFDLIKSRIDSAIEMPIFKLLDPKPNDKYKIVDLKNLNLNTLPDELGNLLIAESQKIILQIHLLGNKIPYMTLLNTFQGNNPYNLQILIEPKIYQKIVNTCGPTSSDAALFKPLMQVKPRKKKCDSLF